MIPDNLSGPILYDLSRIPLAFYISVLFELADKKLHSLTIFICN